jgi:hypothetical protein
VNDQSHPANEWGLPEVDFFGNKDSGLTLCSDCGEISYHTYEYKSNIQSEYKRIWFQMGGYIYHYPENNLYGSCLNGDCPSRVIPPQSRVTYLLKKTFNFRDFGYLNNEKRYYKDYDDKITKLTIDYNNNDIDEKFFVNELERIENEIINLTFEEKSSSLSEKISDFFYNIVIKFRFFPTGVVILSLILAFILFYDFLV